jgi:glyoxylase-like metal-dependent hydrolase (beta-lactamase superfamily II)
MQRRKFLKSGTRLMGLSPFLDLTSPTLFRSMFGSNEEVVKIKIGKINGTFFRDTMFKYLAKDYFINANPEELSQSLIKYNITPDNIPSPFIALLLQTHDRKILIDTGIGFMEKPLVFRGNSYMFKGKLNQLLQQEGIKKEDITDVIITHFHPDHIGGIFNEEQINFPAARFHLPEVEWAFWHSAKSEGQPAMFKFFIEKNITKLQERDLHLFKGDLVELVPGVTAIKAEGHTPGQVGLIVHSQKDHLLYISDAFLHPLHIERLDWQTNYDWDHEKAKQSRIRLLELARKEDMMVNAFHFDFPGLGRIDKKGLGWTWAYSKK